MDNNYFAENIKADHQSARKRKIISVPTLIISIVTTIVLVVIVLNNRTNITEMLGFETQVVETDSSIQLSVGTELALSGEIFDDGDLVNYTHVLDSREYGELGLKSQNINLNNYKGEVYLEGIVEKIQQGVPVVEVDTIYSLDMEEEVNTGQIEEMTGMEVQSVYLANAGLFFDTDFFEKYSLVNDGEGGTVKVKNLDTNYIIDIDYFKCDDSVDNKNCARFNEMFSVSSVQKFINKDGVVYYKQPEIQSWFFSNENLIGYFVNDVEDAKFKDLSKYINVVNSSFVEKHIMPNVSSLCWEPGITMQKVDKYDLKYKNNKLYVYVEGNDGVDSALSCELEINLELKDAAKLISLEVLGDMEDNLSEEDKEDVIISDLGGEDDNGLEDSYDWSTDVEQFPVNLDKALTFTSRRGHTIVFPSSNIAYAGKSTQEDFGQAGVNCFSVMNVVKYADKEYVDQKGNVKIYECSVKDGFDDSSEKFIYKDLGDKHFVIEIVDPAWVDFANNIKITL